MPKVATSQVIRLSEELQNFSPFDSLESHCWFSNFFTNFSYPWHPMQGHTGAAIAYGSLLLRGFEVPESIAKFKSKRSLSPKKCKSAESSVKNPVERAKEQFQIAAKAGCDLGLRWLQRLEEEEKRLLSENLSAEHPSSKR